MIAKKAGVSLLTASLIALFASSSNGAFCAPEKGKSSSSMNVDIDTTGIAKTSKVEIIPKEPYSKEEQVIELNGSPAHIQVYFDGKKIESDNDFTQKHLLIYSIKEFEEVFPANKKPIFNKRIANLKKMIATKSGAGLTEYPVLPASDGGELLHSKLKPQTFKNGSGVTFIGCYGNGDPPYKANDFFYTFQGITTDGKYYVSFFWPVVATGMKPNTEQKKAENFIEQLPRAKFVPSLEALDKAVSSISVKY